MRRTETQKEKNECAILNVVYVSGKAVGPNSVGERDAQVSKLHDLESAWINAVTANIALPAHLYEYHKSIFHRSTRLGHRAASIRRRADASMYKHKLDPIRYAWEHCNPGVPFPSALGRSRDSPLAAPGLVTPWRYDLPPPPAISGDSPVAAALSSWGAPPTDVPEHEPSALPPSPTLSPSPSPKPKLPTRDRRTARPSGRSAFAA